MAMRGRIAYLVLGAGLILLAGCGDFFSKDTGGGGGGGGSASRVYVTNNGDNSISVFRADTSTGVLTQMGGSPFNVGNQPRAVAVDPSGKFLYTANTGDLGIGGFTIDPSTGGL